MTKKVMLPDQIAQFNRELSQASLALPRGFRFVNPFQGQQKDAVNKLVSAFCEKYYAESKPRRMILGSSPARRGTAVSGIPFEDPRCLSLGNDSDTGKFYVMPSSSGFLSEVMKKYGGREKFYADFYMGFVCPLGIVRVNSKGKEVNCNYYEDKKLRDVLHPFIVATLYQQLNFGIDRTVCYCIGSGDNYRFLSKLNEEHDFFDRIVPLEHPRFIMQYHSKDKEKFMKKYIDALSSY